jgi:hypothetical protein
MSIIYHMYKHINEEVIHLEISEEEAGGVLIWNKKRKMEISLNHNSIL